MVGQNDRQTDYSMCHSSAPQQNDTQTNYHIYHNEGTIQIVVLRMIYSVPHEESKKTVFTHFGSYLSN